MVTKMLIGTLIAGLIGGTVVLIRYTIWKSGVPRQVFYLRWVIAMVLTIIAIIIELLVLDQVTGIVYALNGVLFLAVGQVLGETQPIKRSNKELKSVSVSKSESTSESELFCSDCGNPITETAKFCPHCGAVFQEDSQRSKCPNCDTDVNLNDKYCQNCGLDLQASKNVCKKCGNKNTKDSKFCSNCGERLVQIEVKQIDECPNCKKKLLGTEKFCNQCGYKLK